MSRPDRQLVATDDLIERDRGGRLGVFILSLLVLFLGSPTIVSSVTTLWFGHSTSGFYLGLLVAAAALHFALPRFIVQVAALRAFVTIDLLKTFLAKKSTTQDDEKKEDPKAYVTYGPGLHISYPWESRSSQSNVSLEEASENFEAKIQTKIGVFTLKGSVRIRPDIRRLVPFLSGVGSIASDITDLIKAFAVAYLGNKENMNEILAILPDLNTELNKKFGLGEQGTAEEDAQASDFEKRFGLNVGDVTVAELLPSEEVQKTLSGMAEADLVAAGVARILGYSPEELKAARESGKFSQADYDRARRDFMAVSENIKMNVDANEYTLRIEAEDPELVEALGRIAPGFVTLMESMRRGRGQNPQQQSGGKSPKGGE